MAKHWIKLSDEQIRLLPSISPEFRKHHIETRLSGDLADVDTVFVGHLMGVGKVYLRTAIYCHSLYVWGRLYLNKPPVNLVHLLNNNPLPTHDTQQVSISTVLSDIERKLCGRPDRHPNQLSLQLEDIEHRKTEV